MKAHHNLLRLLAWSVCGAGMGCALSWAKLPSGASSSQTRFVSLPSEQSPMPIGITAALLHQKNGALLVDTRPRSARALPVPGSISAQQFAQTASVARSLVVIGDESTIARIAKRHRVNAYVPPFTLGRDAHIPAAWEMSTAQLQQKMRKNAIEVLDVREIDEFADSHLPDSERVSMFEVEQHVKNRKRPVAVFCLTGHRSAFVLRQLRAQGHDNVFSVRGGWLNWKAQKRPLIEAKSRTL